MTPYNAALCLEELRKAIRNVGNGCQANGENPISYIMMISRFTEPIKDILLKFFNFCWDRGEVPLAWKKAVVVPIHKVGKPCDISTSYRPIALASHLGKLYETLAKNHLDCFFRKPRHLLSARQAFAGGGAPWNKMCS